MTGILLHRKIKMDEGIKLLAWPLAYVLVAMAGLYDYINWQSINMLLGLPALFLCSTTHAVTVSKRFIVAAFFFALLNLFLPVKTLLYATVVCGICFCIEQHFGKINRLLPLVAACMSSIFQYFADVFSFPVRLQLTEWAAHILSLAGYKVVAEGNILLLHGREFSVDPACMGLNMFAVSILIGIVAIATYEKQYAKKISWRWVITLLFAFAGLNVVANLLRILCLVVFQIPSESPMHSIAGLICLAVYGFAPSILITKFIIRKSNRHFPEKTNLSTAKPKQKYIPHFHIAMLLLIAFSSLRICFAAKHTDNISGNHINVAGYTITALPAKVYKLQSPGELVYIKQVMGFYSSDHNPSICWRGSGYSFQKIQTRNINGVQIFHAILQKENEQLYTAWWYDNGTNATISQLSWRWDEISSGRHYSIVNITTTSEAALLQSVDRTLKERTFKSVVSR